MAIHFEYENETEMKACNLNHTLPLFRSGQTRHVTRGDSVNTSD